MNRIERNIIKLSETQDAGAACDLINALGKAVKNQTASEEERRAIIEALVQHADHHSGLSASHAAAAALDCVQEKETEYADFFRRCIESGEDGKQFWGILGYAKTMAENAFPYLVEYLFSPGKSLEHKALIVKELSRRSQNPFDLDTPYECRNWTEADIRYNAIREWKERGFPLGEGYPLPVCHACLQEPKTNEEKLYARLEKKLLKKREKDQDFSHPKNWLIKAAPEDLLSIRARWNLPKDYCDFLEKASPLHADFKIKGYGAVEVYGAQDLIRGQDGYSYNPCTQKPIEDWNKNYVVIANRFGDPFCLDISRENSPVYFAFHGEGVWEFTEEFDSFCDFLKSLS